MDHVATSCHRLRCPCCGRFVRVGTLERCPVCSSRGYVALMLAL